MRLGQQEQLRTTDSSVQCHTKKKLSVHLHTHVNIQRADRKMYFKCCYGYFWGGEFRDLVKNFFHRPAHSLSFPIITFLCSWCVCVCVRMSVHTGVCALACIWRPKVNDWHIRLSLSSSFFEAGSLTELGVH